MRWCKNHFWTLSALAVFAALLAFGGHPDPVIGSGTVSAPSAPNAFVQSASFPWLLQSHFNGSGHPSRSAGFVPEPRTIRTVEAASRIARTVQPHYGPLHRRPPPSFS